MQLERVAVHPLSGPGQSSADTLEALLEPGSPAFEDPQAYVRAGLAEEREMHAEPVVLPRRRAGLREQVLQPLLAVRGQPVDDLRSPAGPGTACAIPWLIRLLGDHALRE